MGRRRSGRVRPVIEVPLVARDVCLVIVGGAPVERYRRPDRNGLIRTCLGDRRARVDLAGLLLYFLQRRVDVLRERGVVRVGHRLAVFERLVLEGDRDVGVVDEVRPTLLGLLVVLGRIGWIRGDQ